MPATLCPFWEVRPGQITPALCGMQQTRQQFGKAWLPFASYTCISQGNQGTLQRQAAPPGHVCRLKGTAVKSLTSETKHHMQLSCREQYRHVLTPKLCTKLVWRDGQRLETGQLEVAASWECHQHSHAPSAKVLLQHDARRYWGTHTGLGVQQRFMCCPEIRVKLGDGGSFTEFAEP